MSETMNFKTGAELTCNDRLITKSGRILYIRQIRRNDMGSVILIFSGGRESVVLESTRVRVV